MFPQLYMCFTPEFEGLFLGKFSFILANEGCKNREKHIRMITTMKKQDILVVVLEKARTREHGGPVSTRYLY